MLSLLGAVVAAAAASTAGAGLSLRFDKRSARPGELVTVRSAGEGALGTPRSLSRHKPGETSIVGYLAPNESAGKITSATDPRLVEVGRFVDDGHGNASLTFRLPEIAPGSYTMAVLCPPCASYSTTGERFYASTVDSRTLPSLRAQLLLEVRAPAKNRAWLWILVGGAIAVAVAAGALALRRPSANRAGRLRVRSGQGGAT